jgi:hypothetical protein
MGMTFNDIMSKVASLFKSGKAKEAADLLLSQQPQPANPPVKNVPKLTVIPGGKSPAKSYDTRSTGNDNHPPDHRRF